MSNAFSPINGEIDWERYCEMLEISDVAAFGLTDYFQLSAFFEFKSHFHRLYPRSEKLFFPVVELRLNEAVNGKREDVNFHILFRPDVTEAKLNHFLGALKTELTDEFQRNLSCLDLKTKDQFDSATVSRVSIDAAYSSAFGKAPRESNILTIVPSNNDGIRADTASRRKMNLADQIDKAAQAIFGNAGNARWYLSKDRYENGQGPSRPKPVFTGSDAHNYRDLEMWLGKSAAAPNEKHITWIKGDLTFEGLLQTLVEPEERVQIGDAVPDFKEPYRYIRKITFDSPDFPDEVIFNPNLTSIIGSRSSGKSALLAYIAHAVDPIHAISQQLAVSPGANQNAMGPAAGHTWKSVEWLNREVVWGDQNATAGQVIYVPQNSLYEISTRPEEVTQKIRPALFRAHPDLENLFNEFDSQILPNSSALTLAVESWFASVASERSLQRDVAKLGDRAAIVQARDSIRSEIAEVHKSNSLTDDEIVLFAELSKAIADSDNRAQALKTELDGLARYVVFSEDNAVSAAETVTVSVSASPSGEGLSEELASSIDSVIEDGARSVLERLKVVIVDRYVAAMAEREAMISSAQALREGNVDLFDKFKSLSATSALERRVNEHESVISKIDAGMSAVVKAGSAKVKALEDIEAGLASRSGMYDDLRANFDKEARSLPPMEFGMDFDYAKAELERLALGFNRQASSEFLKEDRQEVDIAAVLGNVEKFLTAVESGTQRIRQGEDAKDLAVRIIVSAPEIRLSATLEGDRIGGFAATTMTPGKQALFALTLILSESDEPWPLLLDQPEDDLDSRSIYEVIVPYLTRGKKGRQIIMVSHNANLVVGADSESVVVANRHGHDRPNRDDRLFDYKSGSLEHSQQFRASGPTLDSRGISEHACEILDGGTDAFEKRKNRYNIRA